MRQLITVSACILLAGAAWGQSGRAPALPTLPSLDRSIAPKPGVTEIDRNGDGATDYVQYADSSGRLEREEMDFNYDGKMDDFYIYQKGVLVREEIDSNFDGKVDIWVFVKDGKYIERTERDKDGDGNAEIVKTYGEN